MSYTLGQLVDCPNIQRKLSDRFALAPVNEFMPFFEFVTSPINNRGLSQEVNPGGGKIRTVTLTYTPRQLESAVAENVANPKCDVSNFVGNNYTNYEIDTNENLQWGFSMTRTDLEAACESNEMYFADRLMDAVDVLDRALATKHTNDVFASIGKWASNVTVNGSNEFEVPTELPSSAIIDPQTHAKIKFALQKTGYSAQTFIFSGNTLAEYYRATLDGCCSEQGIDVSGIFSRYGTAVAYDRRIEAGFADSNKALAVQAGALTLLQYTATPWKSGIRPAIEGANYFQTVITSPRTGVNMDLTVSDDCGTVSVSLVATTKLATLPMDMFRQGDFMQGVNYLAKIKVVNS